MESQFTLVGPLSLNSDDCFRFARESCSLLTDITRLMLTAWDKSRDKQIVLPDYEERGDDGGVRERTREGQIVCPTCQQLLWLHAGTLRTWHFAHRSLSNCPHGRVSEGILSARRLLYLFFQSRITAGKLTGEVNLEPSVKGLPDDLELDLLLKREGKPPVAVLLLESSLKPHVRSWLPPALEKRGFVFRPVFLASRLKQPDEHADEFLLDTAQREFPIDSAYDEAWLGYSCGSSTLHFIDSLKERWTTLRGLHFVHGPQVYRAAKVLSSPMAGLLWSEIHTDWVHGGEADKLKQVREHRRAQELEKARQRAASARRTLPKPRPAPVAAPIKALPPDPEPEMEPEDEIETEAAPEPEPEPQREPDPPWLHEGLICIGCGQRSIHWQNAKPGLGKCVCKDCFATGVRLR